MKRVRLALGALALILTAGCGLFQSGPSDQEIAAVVEKTPPLPPTIGPTFLSEVTSVKVEERGHYNGSGKYWPIRVRVKGAAKSRPNPLLLLALPYAASNKKGQPMEFVEEARLSKDDFDNWQVTYAYDPQGPSWRREQPANPNSP